MLSSERNLEVMRKEIDELDQKLIETCARRHDVIKEVAYYKAKYRIPMMQPERVAEVQKSRAELGQRLNLPDNFVRELYALILKYSCREEDTIIAAVQEEMAKDIS